jgi:hypothetical protein
MQLQAVPALKFHNRREELWWRVLISQRVLSVPKPALSFTLSCTVRCINYYNLCSMHKLRARTPGIRARPGVSRRKSIAAEVPDRAKRAVLSADAGFEHGKHAGNRIRQQVFST